MKDLVRDRFNTDIIYIPGGCTGILQPADVSWNRPFKAAMQECYDEWLFNGQHTFTANGNRRPPPLPLFLTWIKQSWDKITPDIIRKSFKKCGLSNAMDGTEDDLLFQSDDDSDFEGFTAEEIADNDAFRENVRPPPISETVLDSDSTTNNEDSEDDDMYIDPMSPGH